jgi:DNA-binding cell septation regulator SpoVG
VRGFVDVQLPSGLIINSIKLMVGAQGAHWLAMPAVKAADKEGNEVTNRDGKALWNNFVDFASPQIRARFQQETLAALRRKHSELWRAP